MIIKERDSKEADINELSSLMSLNLPDNERFLVERELRFVKSGDRGESDSAYYIDFIYSNSKNWAVVHDLRLEFDGKVAQIDHLMINRMFEFYVLETKNFSYLVKIDEDGQFLVQHGNEYYSIPSPIEQNKRHIYLLKDLLTAKQIMPKRLGIRIVPSFHNYILVSSRSRVIRPSRKKFDTSMIIKSDTLETTIMDNLDHISNLSALSAVSKMVTSETLFEVAQDIAALHRPAGTDYRKRFGIEDLASGQTRKPEHPDMRSVKQYYCFTCKKTIAEKVAKFCWDNKNRFGGKAYCFDCQKGIPK